MRIAMKWSASALFGLAALVLTSGSAIADGSATSPEISVPAPASSECPASISERYPWIACRTTAMGTQVIAGPEGNDAWESRRATPGSHPFVNGIGYFGPVANR